MPDHATTVATTTQQALRRAAGRHIALAATIILDAVYATLIISGINFGDDHRLLPAQISQIVVGTLVCATTIASTIVICGRAGERAETAVAELAARFTADCRAVVRAEISELVAIHGKSLVRDVARIKDRIGMRPDDDPTTPLAGHLRAHTAIYASASMTTVTGSRFDAAVDRLVGRVEEALKVRDDAVQSRLDEMDGRMRDFALLAQGQQWVGARGNGSVARLPTSR